MPNQRSKNKKHISCFIDEATKAKLDKIAKDKGMTMTDVMVFLCSEFVKEEKRKLKSEVH